MAKRNEVPVLLAALLITGGLLAALGFWGWRLVQSRGLGTGSAPPGLPLPEPSTPTTQPDTREPGNTGQPRLSWGTRSLVSRSPSTEKQAGLDAMAAGQFDAAVAAFDTSLAAERNDPETRIYLNNARIGNGPAYTIAVAAPFESALNPALEMVRGVAQAQTEINQAGGLQGVPLRVILADDGSTDATAIEVAQQLANTEEVLAVIGHFSSGTTLATAPIYTEAQVPLISPTSTSVEISGISDYVFRTVPSDRFAATALARYLLQTLQQQQAAVFYNSESDYSTSLKNEFTTAVFSDGGRIVAEFDLAAPDFKAAQALSQLQGQPVDALMLAANTATLDQALAVISANNGQFALLGGDSLYNPKILDIGGAAAEGMVVAVPWHILAAPDAPFVAASRQLWGGDVNWRTATAYDATQTIAAALAETATVNRQTLQQALSAPGFQAQGATSPIQFLPSGDRNQAAQLVIIAPGSRSGYGYDFVPVSP
jgi:branched-chain amino acid transport system substrate-binding protein